MICAANALSLLQDYKKFQQLFWPGSVMTTYQDAIMKSLEKNKITVVAAGNKLGKDYIAAFAGLHFFCSRSPARVITSSVDGSQLEGVLWGEVRNFIQTAEFPLPIQYNHLKLRQKRSDGELVGNAEMIGRVVSKGEGLLGRHLPHGWSEEFQAYCHPSVMAIVDEASGFDEENFKGVPTWAHRILIIGNTFPCENFFKKYVIEGDQKSDSPFLDYDVKVFRIPAIESPNIQLALAEEKRNLKPSRQIVVPGCMDIDDYRWRRKTFDPVLAAAGLDAEFYDGEEVKMFPNEWLDSATSRSESLVGSEIHGRPTMGVDTAEGGDSTVWTVVDSKRILRMVSKKTRNTAKIKGTTIALIKEFNIDPDDVLFDRGGGGKEHADYLRMAGYNVRTIGFGEPPTSVDEYEPGWIDPDHKKDIKEQRYAYKNVRAQLYGTLREMLNPDGFLLQDGPFSIDPKYTELLRQLRPIPLDYDGEGRMVLPPKDKPHKNFKGVTLKQLIGNSPDEADSLSLATFAQVYVSDVTEIGTL